MKNILMNVEMTKAILDGRKVQTRRVFKDDEVIDTFLKNGGELNKIWVIDKYSKYQIGETIWVREPARVNNTFYLDSNYKINISCQYLADDKAITIVRPDRFKDKKWANAYGTNRYGIPNGCIKEMARIFLKITNVRVERLQEISEQDVLKEGIEYIKTFYRIKQGSQLHDHADYAFEELWNKTAPKGYKWEDNPYVFVYEFERVEK